MNNPFEVLGLKGWADQDEIRTAYRTLVKQCHPDMVQDPVQKEAAQQRMIRLNLAYEEALRLAAPRQHAAYIQEIPTGEALILAEKMLVKANPEGALRQLMRAENKNGDWYYTYGKILMHMEKYPEARQAFREAVRKNPDNREYRRWALDAEIAEKKEKTFSGKVQKWARNLKRK